ncbi:unnamed protein product, partial [Amoebophrya sp. A25]
KKVTSAEGSASSSTTTSPSNTGNRHGGGLSTVSSRGVLSGTGSSSPTRTGTSSSEGVYTTTTAPSTTTSSPATATSSTAPVVPPIKVGRMTLKGTSPIFIGNNARIIKDSRSPTSTHSSARGTKTETVPSSAFPRLGEFRIAGLTQSPTLGKREVHAAGRSPVLVKKFEKANHEEPAQTTTAFSTNRKHPTRFSEEVPAAVPEEFDDDAVVTERVKNVPEEVATVVTGVVVVDERTPTGNE